LSPKRIEPRRLAREEGSTGEHRDLVAALDSGHPEHSDGLWICRNAGEPVMPPGFALAGIRRAGAATMVARPPP